MASSLRPLRRALLAWFDRARRPLPWRESPSPYRTVVSEIMLQQTQVAAVIPFFERFTRRFPDFASLAAASTDEVLAVWSGLGYYRRALSLKQAAERITRDHRGEFPAEADSLRALPGFGQYTTAAVGSIVLGLPLAAVDGNVRRVVSRLFAIGETASGPRVAELAQRLLDRARPGDWNQAMMELGATVCVPRAPRCHICPIQKKCAAHAQGEPEKYPAPKAARPRRIVQEIAVAVVRRRRVLLLRRGGKGPFAGI